MAVIIIEPYLQVNHLENTGSALAEDVMQKSAIINQYFMENKAGQWVDAVKLNQISMNIYNTF